MGNSTKSNPFCVLDNVFKEKTEYVQYSFEVYKKIYSLPTIKYERNVSEEFFNYQKNKKYFLLLVPYDEVGRMYLERNAQEKLYWTLPGGSIHKNEDFHIAIKRIANRLNNNSNKLLLREVEPAAFIENKFKYKNQYYTHYGIAFMAKIRNNGALETENSDGCFVNLDKDELNNINHYSNKEVARLCYEKIKCSQDKFSEVEVSTNEKYQYRYFIHNNIIKRFILTPRLKKKDQFLKLINGKLDGAKSFLDISCGDSDILKQLTSYRNFDYIVGNDISWSQVEFINNNNSEVIYTNHNAVHLPFKDNSFDVSYCGNTLHHLNTQTEMRSVLDSMFRVSKKIIIVEIEKPENTGLIPHLLNKYWYQKYLGDVGSSYLSKNDFHSILKSHFFNRAKIEFSEFKNIQGRYLIAEITKEETENKILEVEQKFLYLNNVILEQLLETEGFTEIGTEKEIDNYYSDLEGDFIKNRTCLRIRIKNNFAELTHKGKSHNFLGSFAKVEHNIPISVDSVTEYSDILNSLGFSKYVTVEKTRRTFIKNCYPYHYTIALDNLNRIGEFIEFEVSGDVENSEINKKDAEIILKEIIKIFSPCGLEPADLPYRDYIANYLSKKFLYKNKIKTIIFDFDEILIPAKSLFLNSLQETILSDYGLMLSFDEYDRYGTLKNEDLIEYLLSKGIEITNPHIFKDKVYLKYSNKLDKLLSSTKILNNFSAIKALKKSGYRVGLISASSLEYINNILSLLGDEGLFEQIATSENIIDKKSDTEIYQIILNKMETSKDNCLVIEGSSKSLESAQRANLNCALVTEQAWLNKQDLINCNIPTFDNITQIFMILSFAEKK